MPQRRLILGAFMVLGENDVSRPVSEDELIERDMVLPFFLPLIGAEHAGRSSRKGDQNSRQAEPSDDNRQRPSRIAALAPHFRLSFRTAQ